jgi:hypothetical protein
MKNKKESNMTELKATPVVKNKFWIVERDGEKVATIQLVEDGTAVWVDNQYREKYATIKMLKDKHNVDFVKQSRAKKVSTGHNVHGYPADCVPHNPLYDVSKKLPIYTQDNKSKSFYCAGYYLVRLNHHWSKTYCPKLITLQRYEFSGPFKTTEEQQQMLRVKNGL